VTTIGNAILSVRLVPVEQLTSRLVRTIKSLASSLEKEVDVAILGSDTEIDKVLADELADPLLHLVRNALDHGLEPPAERVRLGKPRRGQLRLAVEARGRDVVFTLSDDGRGIDPELVLRRARERGLLLEDDPGPSDPIELIFEPGFTTKTSASEISGRGVGLDVVRTNIAAVKGRVSVRSRPGQGCAFEVVVPMTLALVETLLVRSGGRFFGFPTSDVRRTIAVEPGQLRLSGGRPVIALDDSDLPLLRLDHLLGLRREKAGARQEVVVVEQGATRAGFVVSTIEGIRDVVVKPLPPDVPRLPEITGTAELPDGDLALTLDTARLLSKAHAWEATVG
jgi:two-component system chemotaxis sensor kinase CheA